MITAYEWDECGKHSGLINRLTTNNHLVHVRWQLELIASRRLWSLTSRARRQGSTVILEASDVAAFDQHLCDKLDSTGQARFAVEWARTAKQFEAIAIAVRASSLILQ